MEWNERAAGSHMAGTRQTLGAALVLIYHLPAGQTISCKIIGAAANFLSGPEFWARVLGKTSC